MRIFFLVVAFFGIILTSQAQDIEIREMAINADSYALLDFGSIKAKKTIKKELLIINTGTLPLVINKIEEGCDCTTAKLKKKVLAPNQSTVLCLKWRPIDNSEFHSSIMLHSNAKNHPNLWIQMEGNQSTH